MAPVEKLTNESLFDAIFALGKNFFLQGKYDKAQVIFDGLMALHPNHPLPAIAYGETLLMDGQIDKALEHFLGLSERFEVDSEILLGAARACILLEKREHAKKLLLPIIEGAISATSRTRSIAQSIYTAVTMGDANAV